MALKIARKTKSVATNTERQATLIISESGKNYRKMSFNIKFHRPNHEKLHITYQLGLGVT